MLYFRALLVPVLIALAAIGASLAEGGGMKGAGTVLDGTVSRVDTTGRTVNLATGYLGIFGETLTVDDHTRIRVEGRPATLAEVPEGARVKASFEIRGGQSVATRLDVAAPDAPLVR